MPKALLSFAMLLGLAGCFFIPPSTPVYGMISLILPSDARGTSGYSDYDATAYACIGDPIEVHYRIEGDASATLSADPADALSPALPATQVAGDAIFFGFRVRRVATVMLDYRGGAAEARLELVPSDVCTGFPTDLLRRFTGKLAQTAPTPQTLPRQLAFYWRESGLEATLSGSDTNGYKLQLQCTANSSANSVSCTGVDADFSLEATVSEDGLTGSYEGTTSGSVSSSPFSGTLSFEAAP